jgi:hypothetical protein
MAAAGVVRTLVAQIEDELDAVVEGICDRIREEIPDFRRLPRATLARAVRGNVSRALAALRELRDPTEDELEQAREEQQRRDAFVFAILTGTLDPDELRRESATFGVDPEREYIPFRARGRLKPDGMSIALDHDVAGLTTSAPSPPAGVTVGFAAPARLEALPTGFAHASRALQTALAFGQTGAFSLADLSIRPAILADEALGDAFAERHLAPIRGLGMELEDTLRTYLDLGMKIDETARTLHVHANTLRHRLRRFEEATGANLRDPRVVVELWWALERRRLQT